MTEIFHITHVDNLSQIVKSGGLLSDFRLNQERLESMNRRVNIGYEDIKNRRLTLPVSSHPGTMVGEYVPFYFCPRSVMLYVIHRCHPKLCYQGGQGEIVHLVSTVQSAVNASVDRPWAFSDGNAGAFYTRFYNSLDQLDRVIDWDAVNSSDWRDPAIKEKKQAEFLVHDHFPWTSIHQIGVYEENIALRVQHAFENHSHHPEVIIRPKWYY